MKKIAVVYEGDLSNRFGGHNSIQNRIVHLRQCADYRIDALVMQVYDGRVMRLLRRSRRITRRPAETTVGEVTYAVKWFKRSWIDAATHHAFDGEPRKMMRFIDQLAHTLKDYNLISAHDRIGGLLAMRVNELYGTPFFITWHGYSIHTDPFCDKMVRRQTVRLLTAAKCNFFVSRTLAEKAHELTRQDFAGDVLPNGVSADFKRYGEAERTALRCKEGVDGCKVVAFVARFDPIKNTQLLPHIFEQIANRYEEKVLFWAIGDGPTRKSVEKSMRVPCKFWGYQEPKLIPVLMNCIDVLVLPSKREGMPLVSIEAIKCGAGVVASNRLGACDYIGRDNVFDPDSPTFVDDISTRAVAMLNGEVQPQKIDGSLSWEETAKKENAFYTQCLEQSGK